VILTFSLIWSFNFKKEIFCGKSPDTAKLNSCIYWARKDVAGLFNTLTTLYEHGHSLPENITREDMIRIGFQSAKIKLSCFILRWTRSIHIFIYSYIHIFIYSYIHIFIYSYIHIFIYSYIHIFIYSLFFKEKLSGIAYREFFGTTELIRLGIGRFLKELRDNIIVNCILLSSYFITLFLSLTLTLSPVYVFWQFWEFAVLTVRNVWKVNQSNKQNRNPISFFIADTTTL
jgi:hypothetical protein